MAQQLASLASRTLLRLGRAAGACALLAVAAAAPHAAFAQGAPSNAADPGGSFAGAQSPRAGGESAERPWRASLRAFADYDSNIGLTEEQAPFPFEAEGALRAGVSGSGSYRLLSGERLEAGVGGYFLQTITAGDSFADEYDLSTLAPQLWTNLRFAFGETPGFAQLAYEFRRDWLEGDDFERSHSLRASGGVRPRENLELEASYRIGFNDFDASGFHALDARRDADHHRFGLAATWLRLAEAQRLTLAYEYLSNHAELDEYDFTGHGVTARFRSALGRYALLDLLASYTSADYFRYPTAPRREARTQSYRARVVLPVAESLSADLGYGYLRVGADQAQFRSKRHLVSAGLTYHF
jgi:hypothetical protein